MFSLNKQKILYLYLLLFLNTIFGLNSEKLINGWKFIHNDIEYKITVVDSAIFHIQIYPSDKNNIQRYKTFIDPVFQKSLKNFKKSKSFKLSSAKKRFEIKTIKGTIIFDKNRFRVTVLNRDKEKIIKNGKINLTNNYSFSYTGQYKERTYGIGNPALGKSGGLIKSATVTGIEGGVTKLPFYWSSAGYGILTHYEDAGVFWHRTQNNHVITVPDKSLNMYIFLGKTPYEILRSYTLLTGRPPIPPLWSFGFMMSRWGYKDWDDIKDKWLIFRKKQIPVDVFIYDYDWFVEDWKWNPKTFPNPEKNLQFAKDNGIKIVGIRKPRCDDEDNLVFIKKKDWLLHGTPSDFNLFLPEVQKWWWKKHIPFIKDGIVGWWNDEAEHEFLEYFYMVKTQYTGLQNIKHRHRVWTINRAFTPGLQRLGAAVWTGDVKSTWDDLQNQPGTFLNYSITGMPYSSSDIGGFHGTPSGNLYTRWIQLGIFTPVMRAHGAKNLDRWPWAFGKNIENYVKSAIELRYRFIPYLYSNARNCNLTGAPILSPLFFEFPDEPQTYNMEDEYLVGKNILAAPVFNKENNREIYLPKTRWYDFNTGKIIQGPCQINQNIDLEKTPIFIRGGSIIPLQSIMQYTNEKEIVPLEINVYTGNNGNFKLYRDDGITYNYTTGEYKECILEWDEKNKIFIVNKSTGNYKSVKKYFVKKIKIYGLEKPTKITINNDSLEYVYNKEVIEIELDNFELNKKYIFKIYAEIKEEDIKANYTDFLLLEQDAINGNVQAIDKLIKRLKNSKPKQKFRILNILGNFLEKDNVYNLIDMLLKQNNIDVKEHILKIINAYSPDKKYAELILPYAFNADKKILPLIHDIINIHYHNQANMYFGTPIQDWYVIGPFSNKNNVAFNKGYLPETEIDLNAVYNGINEKVRWKKIKSNDNGIINLLNIYPETPDYVCAYLVTVIESPGDIETELWIGSDDGNVIWLNGKKVWKNNTGRGLTVDEDKTKIKLKKGRNILTCMVSQNTGGWKFTTRLIDKKGRLQKIKYSNELSKKVTFEEYEYTGKLININSVNVSSVQDNKNEHNSAKLIDKNKNSRWSSDFKDNQWILLDLGKTKEIDRFILYWENAHAKKYEIEISKNKIDWVEVYKTNNSNGNIETIDINTSNCRYIKINLLKRATQWGFSLFEIEIYNNL